jgi:hypothetical protein
VRKLGKICRITAWQGVLEGKKIDRMVHKSCETGAKSIGEMVAACPACGERTVPVNGEDLSKQSELRILSD